jgi:hypothetical protein
MTSTPHGRVVAVTLTRELASGELVTMPLTSGRIPGGVFLTTSAILREKRVQLNKRRKSFIASVESVSEWALTVRLCSHL